MTHFWRHIHCIWAGWEEQHGRVADFVGIGDCIIGKVVYGVIWYLQISLADYIVWWPLRAERSQYFS